MLSYWTCVDIMEALLKKPSSQKKRLLGGYSDPVVKKWDGIMKRVCFFCLFVSLVKGYF